MADSADNRLPAHGLDADSVLDRLDELAVDDRDWRGGRVFSLVYNAGDEVLDLLTRAANRYSSENALNTMAFPSLGRMQQDIITITTGLLGGDRRIGGSAGVRGFLTSGGTESLLQATKTARDHGRTERGITRPNMVLATSAHAAFAKAGHYFDVESRRVPVRADGSADVNAMADAADDNTVLVVGSAPSYPHGVIDPIGELGQLALDHGLLLHVDACLGGLLLPWLVEAGHVNVPFDLTVPGVTSISADLHKYGYASKGVSVILYNDADLARHQLFVTSDWMGGFYASTVMAGTRPADIKARIVTAAPLAFGSITPMASPVSPSSSLRPRMTAPSSRRL
jgi:glutamate/tyrosine decarboxylase-like PLP-dependent enzyme